MPRRGSPPVGGKAAREFVSEVEEILDRMRDDLADLADGRSRGELDPDGVNRLFRSAHTLKGLSGMFGLEEVSRLAHRLEDVLDGLRMGRLTPASPALDLLDEAVEAVACVLPAVGGAEPVDGTVLSELAGRIERALDAPSSSAPAVGIAIDDAILRTLTEYEEHRLREGVERGRSIYLLEATFDILSFESGLSELTECARELGELISTLPGPGAAPASQIRFSLLVASDRSPADMEGRTAPGAELRCLHRGSGAPGPQVGAAANARSPAAERPAPGFERGAPRALAAADAGEGDSLRSISETVRVDIRKLDELMNLLGELVIQRAAVGSLASRMLADPTAARFGAELAKIHKTLDRRLQELQAGIVEVRMVPLRQVFDKLSRVVRKLRREAGKEVRLELRGGDTELDKLIVEELADPLMHVVRNAFDHAIETPEERDARGKPREGCIRLEAFQRGNHVVVQVSDDGRGIDPQRLRERAQALRLVSPEAALSRREILELIFLPGLSTASTVGETSGRGVGMDVVRQNVTGLGGTVGVESEPGRGTVISITLPITLAIIQALTVSAGGQRFAIPLTSVLETLVIDAQAIQRSEGRELLDLRGEPLPLLRLHAEFGLPAPAPGARPAVVVVGIGDARAGLVVDQLDGQRDAVIKSIRGPLRSVRGVAGASEVGDLGTVLVLDVAALVEDRARRREAA